MTPRPAAGLAAATHVDGAVLTERMKRSGILNAPLLNAIGRLGHRQTFAVVDCGMPVPAAARLIDLAVVQGVPRIADVVDALLAEVVVEEALVASESAGSDLDLAVRSAVPATSAVPHDELKALLADASFVVRTGEATPYANVLFTAGVAF